MNAKELFEHALETQRNVASFMLRFTQDIWQDENGEPRVQWQGRVNHVQGEEEIPFTDFAEALAFIQNQLNDMTVSAISGGAMEQDKVLKESFKLWEQFASSYSNMMLEAMEKTLEQSQALRSQMDEAVGDAMKAWQMPIPFTTGQDKLLNVITELQEQVAHLTRKVEKLEKASKK